MMSGRSNQLVEPSWFDRPLIIALPQSIENLQDMVNDEDMPVDMPVQPQPSSSATMDADAPTVPNPSVDDKRGIEKDVKPVDKPHVCQADGSNS